MAATVITESTLEDVVGAIISAANPERVYLFGSHARGETGKDSDLDLMVIEDDPFGELRNRLGEIQRIRRALSGFRFPKDILVFSRDEFERWNGTLNHIIGRCLREGRLLYERR